MTLMLWIACLVGVAVGGYAVGHHRMQVEVRRLLSALTHAKVQLKAAQTTEEILRNIREGTLGVEDLRQAGFDLALAETPSLPAGEEVGATPFSILTDDRYQPFKRRHRAWHLRPHLTHITSLESGHEVWVLFSDISLDTAYGVWLPPRVSASCSQTDRYRARLRRVDDGTLELAIEPSDEARDFHATENYDVRVQHVVVLRRQDRWRGS